MVPTAPQERLYWRRRGCRRGGRPLTLASARRFHHARIAHTSASEGGSGWPWKHGSQMGAPSGNLSRSCELSCAFQRSPHRIFGRSRPSSPPISPDRHGAPHWAHSLTRFTSSALIASTPIVVDITLSLPALTVTGRRSWCLHGDWPQRPTWNSWCGSNGSRRSQGRRDAMPRQRSGVTAARGQPPTCLHHPLGTLSSTDWPAGANRTSMISMSALRHDDITTRTPTSVMTPAANTSNSRKAGT